MPRRHSICGQGRLPQPSRRDAFTLIELLTVIAIIGILAGIVIGVGRRASESGREARAKVELSAISTALESYKRQYGDYPRTNQPEQMLQALIGKVDANLNLVSQQSRVLLDLALFTTKPEIDPLTNTTVRLVDPWGNAYAYVYKIPSSGWTNPSAIIYSSGPDGLDDPSLVNGGFPKVDSAANLDNIYASN